MRNFTEKYTELYDSVKHVPRRQLEVISTEQRGDDLGTYLYPQFESSNINLFLLSQKIAEEGFVEEYCLDSEDVQKIRIIRKNLENNPLLKDELIQALEKYLPMCYDEFIKKFPLGHQERIINNIRCDIGKEARYILEQKFENITKDDIKVKELKINL